MWESGCLHFSELPNILTKIANVENSEKRNRMQYSEKCSEQRCGKFASSWLSQSSKFFDCRIRGCWKNPFDTRVNFTVQSKGKKLLNGQRSSLGSKICFVIYFVCVYVVEENKLVLFSQPSLLNKWACKLDKPRERIYSGNFHGKENHVLVWDKPGTDRWFFLSQISATLLVRFVCFRRILSAKIRDQSIFVGIIL